MIYFFLLLGIGSLIGFSSGLFGIGGALVATPLLRLFVDMPPMLALATPLPVALPSALSGSIAYYKNNMINFTIVRFILLGALPANLLGTWITKFMAGEMMMIFTAGFMLLVGVSFFIRSWLFAENESPLRLSRSVLLLTGCLAGFLAGFLAIGGGLVMVPAFVRLLNMKFKDATATSLFCVAILSIPASIGHFLLGHINLSATLMLTLMAAPFSYLGARLAIWLRNVTLERSYGLFMMLFALYFFYRQW